MAFGVLTHYKSVNLFGGNKLNLIRFKSHPLHYPLRTHSGQKGVGVRSRLHNRFLLDTIQGRISSSPKVIVCNPKHRCVSDKVERPSCLIVLYACKASRNLADVYCGPPSFLIVKFAVRAH